MRKFQRAAVVSAVVAGLSVLSVGVGFADDTDGPQQSGFVTFPASTVGKSDTTKPASQESFKYEIDLSPFFVPFATK
ncbi:hypothetical protein LXH13_03920 [Streptomyces spinosirectus]|jgi:hypothetical protein|uniref:hypothetical protein n=1 Tax=Streptomyces TaxID=1883 RepID=UPI000D3809D3|nr:MULTISPECIES: hypothetical protein [Streptomyces]MBY8341511.1 hypothetical protein [Streptomyces plumbidurans]PTM96648.1 hypothetical protein C7821_10430 [Streptomyces sp. VMFN-G11Ma]UIR16227.1 hypothetical protein LXH13_03920 [Streptomyces spinosirectus]